MLYTVMLSLSAVISLVPASVVVARRADRQGGQGKDRIFWMLLAVAVTGPVAWTATHLRLEWHTGISTSLWVTIATAMILFAGLCITTKWAWRLTPLLLPYLGVLGTVATLVRNAPDTALAGGGSGIWIGLHIAVSVMTYALLTLAAVAALAAFLRERALKARQPRPFTRILPPLAESERLEMRLLIVCEIILAFGLISGIAVLYFETGRFFVVDHKVIFSIATFVVIAGLLIARRKSGVRGRAAARLVLFAYLLLTLAYPGVKFVGDILVKGS